MIIRDLILGVTLALIMMAFIFYQLNNYIFNGFNIDMAVKKEATMGLLLAIINYIIFALINKFTLGLGHEKFIFWNSGSHVCRFFLLLLAIIFSRYLGVNNIISFVIYTFIGYFTFLCIEIITLKSQVQELKNRYD